MDGGGGTDAVAAIVGGAWRRRQQLDEVKGGSAEQGARPGEGCSKRRRIKSDPAEVVAATVEVRGELTMATEGGGGGWLLSTMSIYSRNSTYCCTISTYVIGERSICGYLHKT